MARRDGYLDFEVENHFSLWLIRPITMRARELVEAVPQGLHAVGVDIRAVAPGQLDHQVGEVHVALLVVPEPHEGLADALRAEVGGMSGGHRRVQLGEDGGGLGFGH